MKQCMELIYERFSLYFYPEGAVQFKAHPMVSSKALAEDEVTVFDEQVYLSVGHFPSPTGKQINTTDSSDEVTTSATESKDGEFFEVKLHFEFKNPTKTQVTLCEALDWKPYHIILNQMDFTGKVASRRMIRNGIGQSRVTVTENLGIISVDITVKNTSGIQLITQANSEASSHTDF